MQRYLQGAWEFGARKLDGNGEKPFTHEEEIFSQGIIDGSRLQSRSKKNLCNGVECQLQRRRSKRRITTMTSPSSSTSSHKKMDQKQEPLCLFWTSFFQWKKIFTAAEFLARSAQRSSSRILHSWSLREHSQGPCFAKNPSIPGWDPRRQRLAF